MEKLRPLKNKRLMPLGIKSLLLSWLLASSAFAQPVVTEAPAAPNATPRLTGPQKIAIRLAELRANDLKAKPPEGGIHFVGSSSFELWYSMEEDFSEFPVVNRGIRGAEIPLIQEHLAEFVFPYKPGLIVTYIGENDIAAKQTPEQAAGRVSDFIKTIRKNLEDVPIVIMGIKPSPHRAELTGAFIEFDKRVQEIAKADKHVTFFEAGKPLLTPEGKIDPGMYKDTIHLNKKGYAIWTAALKPVLKEAVESAPSSPAN